VLELELELLAVSNQLIKITMWIHHGMSLLNLKCFGCLTNSLFGLSNESPGASRCFYRFLGAKNQEPDKQDDKQLHWPHTEH
jgi:hypothetical protein